MVSKINRVETWRSASLLHVMRCFVCLLLLSAVLALSSSRALAQATPIPTPSLQNADVSYDLNDANTISRKTRRTWIWGMIAGVVVAASLLLFIAFR